MRDRILLLVGVLAALSGAGRAESPHQWEATWSKPLLYTRVEVSPAFMMDGGWGSALRFERDRYQMLDFSLSPGDRRVLKLLSQGDLLREGDRLTLLDSKAEPWLSFRLSEGEACLQPDREWEEDYRLQPADGGDFVGQAVVTGLEGLHPGVTLGEVERRFGKGQVPPGQPPGTLDFGLRLRVRVDPEGVVYRIETNP